MMKTIDKRMFLFTGLLILGFAFVAHAQAESRNDEFAAERSISDGSASPVSGKEEVRIGIGKEPRSSASSDGEKRMDPSDNDDVKR